MSNLGAIYARIYSRLCGVAPQERFWHFQWLATRDLYRDLRRHFPDPAGDILDVGCGPKPYGPWLKGLSRHVGVDVKGGPMVDFIICPGCAWPLPSESFDNVLCTQVLQYVRDPPQLLSECQRVLKPAGRLILTVPFVYNQHGIAADYWRWSADGGIRMLEEGFVIEKCIRQGGIGSTVGLLLLNWMDWQASRTAWRRTLRGLLLPAWVFTSGFINSLGALVDWLGSSPLYYHNVMLVARKR